ncbi:MAG: hypothetical protein IJZ23_05250 [Roseburia sp.]|nr:hypothetical protein [Roseburia sp.]
MKKLLVSILTICTLTALCACGGTEENNDAQDTQVVVEDTQVVVADTQEGETEVVDDGKVNYSVKVVDEAGNPIAGAMVQMCKESCFPSVTGEDGVAKFSLAEDDYKVSFLTLPAGYTYSGDAQEFYFEAGAVELTITLKPEA